MVTGQRVSKTIALRFAKKWTPVYAELHRELKQEGGRVALGGRYATFRGTIAAYVMLYDDERKIGSVMMKALLGEAGLSEFVLESAQWSERELSEFTEYSFSEELEQDLIDLLNLPKNDTEWKEREKVFHSLSESERAEATTRDICLFAGVFSQVFNTLSLMTHGAKLTTLVPQAIAGNDDALLKAAQVDRYLLTHHPYFIQRKQDAQDRGEEEFLRKLAYRESNPNLAGKIRYPALFMLFGILESIQWLDDLSHNDILDICDEIGLDRYQNRIEDTNYVTKRLLEYRQFQKTGGVSMH